MEQEPQNPIQQYPASSAPVVPVDHEAPKTQQATKPPLTPAEEPFFRVCGTLVSGFALAVGIVSVLAVVYVMYRVVRWAWFTP